ncbi:Mg2+ transporter protein [Penicillium nucicola]|uniref:Mg2+ transporter protein n=1 Tax=Penicillium nucicola TaxID=1850975 RepID=UPI0025458E86|nr:Mg2+ transporter protein [Penicillium nucicola]KAJ5770976.1 Mg2+ transporter protein [Penicillium nucicola]
MGSTTGIGAKVPVVALENGDAALQEKVDITETTHCSLFSTQLDVLAYAPSIQSLKSSYPTLDLLLRTDMPSGLWWLHVDSPSDDDIESLSRMLDIHPLTTEDIKIREPREKTELFGPYYFVSLRPPKQLETWESVRASSLTNTRKNVLGRIQEQRTHFPLTSDWICYALIDDIVDGFAPFIHRIQAVLEVMEDSVSVTRPDDIGLALQSIFKARKEVIRIRQLLHEKTDAIQCFARHCGTFGAAPTEVGIHLSDIQDHILTMLSNLANAEQMLSRLQSKYLAQVSFDSTRIRNEIATALSRLTVVGVVVVMMQFITGLFAMNIEVPGENATGLAWWLGIFGIIVGLIVLFFIVAKRIRAI